MPRCALGQSDHNGLTFGFLSDHAIQLPMTEFLAKIYDFGAFFNAFAQDPLVFLSFFALGITAELLGKINVFDG